MPTRSWKDVIVSADLFFRISAAPLLCAGVTAYGALKKVSQFLTGGKAINIIGCGGVGMMHLSLPCVRINLDVIGLTIALGHLVIMYAKAVGYRVHACKPSTISSTYPIHHGSLTIPSVDVGEEKLQLARDCGANKVYDSTTISPTDITPLAATIVASGAAPAYDLAFKATQNHGRIIAIGVPRGDISVSILDMIKRDLSLIATNQGTKQELAEALDIAATHGLKPVYEMRELKQINEGFQDMMKGKILGRLVYNMA